MLEQDKAKCKEKQAEASRLTEGKKPSDGNKFPYRKQFDKLPDVMDELVEHMQQLQGRIDCMGIESTNVSIVSVSLKASFCRLKYWSIIRNKNINIIISLSFIEN